MEKLTNDEKTLLIETITKRSPQYSGAVQGLGLNSLLPEVKEAIQQTILDEMYEHGLESNDEPNDYGKQLDSIVGKLESY